MLSEYEAKRIQYEVMQGFDTSPRPVITLIAALVIAVGLGWLIAYAWADVDVPAAPQAQEQKRV